MLDNKCILFYYPKSSQQNASKVVSKLEFLK